jgi:tetratricopeptide (TPR) repeat protein
MRILALLGVAGGMVIALLGGGARAESPTTTAPSPIERARAALYRYDGISILEDALRATPDDPKLWAEYVETLNTDDFDVLADRAVRHALRLHPRDPDLMLAHARLVGDGAAIDILRELAIVKGYEEIASRLAEWASLMRDVPHPQNRSFKTAQPWDYPLWSDRLIILERFGRAAEVIEQGLRAAEREPDVKWRLLMRRGVLLALQNRFDDALAAQRAAGPTQERLDGSWFGVADVMLAKGRADLALATFDDEPPADIDFRRIYAIALVRLGDAAGAGALLEENDFEDSLILLRVFIIGGRLDRAKTLGKRIIEPMIVPSGGSYGGPWLVNYSGPESLANEYRDACRWLLATFPDRKDGIAFVLGNGNDAMERYRGGWSFIRPMSEVNRELEAKLEAGAGGGDDEVWLRQWLSGNYRRQSRFDEAAAVLEPIVLGHVTAKHPPQRAGTELSVASEWSFLRRRALAARDAATDFWHLASARPLLGGLKIRGVHYRPTLSRAAPSDDEIVAGIVKLGPSALADVIERYAPNAITGTDRQPWLTIIRELGSTRDAPILIVQMRQMVRDLDWANKTATKATYRASIAEHSAGLEKLSGARCAATQPAEQAAFWEEWWRRERQRIVTGK